MFRSTGGFVPLQVFRESLRIGSGVALDMAGGTRTIDANRNAFFASASVSGGLSVTGSSAFSGSMNIVSGLLAVNTGSIIIGTSQSLLFRSSSGNPHGASITLNSDNQLWFNLPRDGMLFRNPESQIAPFWIIPGEVRIGQQTNLTQNGTLIIDANRNAFFANASVSGGLSVTGSSVFSGSVSIVSGTFRTTGSFDGGRTHELSAYIGSGSVNTNTLDPNAPETLLVSSSNYNAIVAEGNLNNYMQLNVWNNNAGTSASSDIVATSDNGTQLSQYMNMGINSTNYQYTGFIGSASDGYLFLTSSIGQMLIGHGSSAPSSNIRIFTGGPNAYRNTRIFVSSSGWVGVNMTQSVLNGATMEVSGNLNIVNGTITVNGATLGGGVGSPGGANSSIQYNNNGTFAGVVSASVSSQGLFELDDTPYSSSITPAPGGTVIYTKPKGGRRMLAQMGPSGVDYSYQPFIGTNKVCYFAPTGNGNVAANITVFGIAITPQGTATVRNVETTSFFRSLRRIGYVSAATANNSAGIRSAALQFWRGSATNMGGWHFVCRFGASDAATVANARSFIGFASIATLIGNVDPNTLTNMIGVGHNSANANLQMMTNDGTGTATQIDLGASFPANTLSTDVYEFRMFASPGGTSVGWYIENLGTGVAREGTITTDLPVNTTLLAPHVWRHNGGTALAVGIDVISLYIETDN
jgi:hypothetical protein